jgi:hypothetical protein
MLATVLISLSLSHFLWGPTLSVCLTNLSPFQSNFQVPPSTYTQRERGEREKRRKRKEKTTEMGSCVKLAA